MDDRSYAYDPVGAGAPVNQQAYRMEAGQLWRQYVIAAVANIAVASTGYSMGWTSPINVKLERPEESPLPEKITADQGAWIGSLLTVGAIIGSFTGGLAVSKIGRKWGLFSSAIPLFLGWILVAAATNVGLIYGGRICWGVAAGMVFAILPMYCAEIATDESRGALGSFLQSFITVGFLLVYGIGPFVSYSAVAYVGVAFVAVFTVAFFFMPETPTYHLTKNNREAAAACLATIRGRSLGGVQAELDKIEADVRAVQAKTATVHSGRVPRQQLQGVLHLVRADVLPTVLWYQRRALLHDGHLSGRRLLARACHCHHHHWSCAAGGVVHHPVRGGPARQEDPAAHFQLRHRRRSRPARHVLPASRSEVARGGVARVPADPVAGAVHSDVLLGAGPAALGRHVRAAAHRGEGHRLAHRHRLLLAAILPHHQILQLDSKRGGHVHDILDLRRLLRGCILLHAVRGARDQGQELHRDSGYARWQDLDKGRKGLNGIGIQDDECKFFTTTLLAR